MLTSVKNLHQWNLVHTFTPITTRHNKMRDLKFKEDDNVKVCKNSWTKGRSGYIVKNDISTKDYKVQFNDDENWIGYYDESELVRD